VSLGSIAVEVNVARRDATGLIVRQLDPELTSAGHLLSEFSKSHLRTAFPAAGCSLGILSDER
jgi:hypothetical protein